MYTYLEVAPNLLIYGIVMEWVPFNIPDLFGGTWNNNWYCPLENYYALCLVCCGFPLACLIHQVGYKNYWRGILFRELSISRKLFRFAIFQCFFFQYSNIRFEKITFSRNSGQWNFEIPISLEDLWMLLLEAQNLT